MKLLDKLNRAISLLEEIKMELTQSQDQMDLGQGKKGEESEVGITPPAGGRFAWKYYVEELFQKDELFTMEQVAIYLSKKNRQGSIPSPYFKDRASQTLSNMFNRREIGRWSNPHSSGYLYGQRQLFKQDASGFYTIKVGKD